MTTPISSNDRLLKFLQAPPAIQEEIDRILSGRVSERKEGGNGPLLLRVSAAAKLLGCSRTLIWRLCREKRLPRVEIRKGSFRIRRSDLEALAAGKVVRHDANK